MMNQLGLMPPSWRPIRMGSYVRCMYKMVLVKLTITSWPDPNGLILPAMLRCAKFF